VGPVSYKVQVEDRVIKRHVDHLLRGEISKSRGSGDEVVPGSLPQPTVAPSPKKSPAYKTPFHTPEEIQSGSPVRLPMNPIP
jgi:hypothetical protein